MRRYSRNILQWRKIETKNTNPTHWRLLKLLRPTLMEIHMIQTNRTRIGIKVLSNRFNVLNEKIPLI